MLAGGLILDASPADAQPLAAAVHGRGAHVGPGPAGGVVGRIGDGSARAPRTAPPRETAPAAVPDARTAGAYGYPWDHRAGRAGGDHGGVPSGGGWRPPERLPAAPTEAVATGRRAAAEARAVSPPANRGAGATGVLSASARLLTGIDNSPGIGPGDARGNGRADPLGRATGPILRNANAHGDHGDHGKGGAGSAATRVARALPPVRSHNPTAPRPAGTGSNPPSPVPPIALLLVASLPESVSGRPDSSFVVPVPAAAALLPARPAPAAGPGPNRRTEPDSLLPDIARSFFQVPGNLLHDGWAGQSLKAATKLKFPIAFLAVAAVFFLIQALIDRRDPKLSRAPERQGEDSVEFE